VNNAHLISEIIGLCGGINVFGDQNPLTPEVSREALLAVRPDIVLGGSSTDTAATFAARWAALPPPLNLLPARHLPADLMQRPTPRILEGARQLCAHLDGVRVAQR
jgi:iron complex transport system substrate-binding protein